MKEFFIGVALMVVIGVYYYLFSFLNKPTTLFVLNTSEQLYTVEFRNMEKCTQARDTLQVVFDKWESATQVFCGSTR